MTAERCIALLNQIRVLIEETIREHEGIGPANKKSPIRPKAHSGTSELSFSTNALAFMKKNVRGLSGPQKFTLLLARLVEGRVSKEVSFAELEKQWNKMTVILGGKFNAAYANRAKANGWVDAPKHGTYALSKTWKSALKKG